MLVLNQNCCKLTTDSEHKALAQSFVFCYKIHVQKEYWLLFVDHVGRKIEEMKQEDFGR